MNILVSNSFKKNTLLTHRKDKAFTVFLAKSDHTPKYLAYYCDDMFRSGLKGDLDKEEVVNAKLDEAMDLLCCLTSRDTFVLSYSTFLSKRLLNKQFLSIDIEKQFLSKLKFELGSTSVNKLSIMFTDLDASENLMKNWKGMKHGVGSLLICRVPCKALSLVSECSLTGLGLRKHLLLFLYLLSSRIQLMHSCYSTPTRSRRPRLSGCSTMAPWSLKLSSPRTCITSLVQPPRASSCLLSITCSLINTKN